MEETKSLVFMFSGQGSQYYQMGKELYQTHNVFRDTISELNDFVVEYFEIDVLNSLYGNERSLPFNHTLLSHCALFMTEFALTKALISEGIKPHLYLGASLGEFVSASLSGAVETTDILKNLISQAEILDEQCSPGKMLAILASTDLFYQNTSIFQNSDLASINFDTHFVVAAENKEIASIQRFLIQKNIAHQELSAPHAFHSRNLDVAMPSYLGALQNVSYNHPTIPLVSCMKAREITEIDSRHFWSVIREPIEFKKTIQYLENRSNHIYIDIGPSGTLATFVNYILPSHSSSFSLAVMTPFTNQVDSFYALVDRLSTRVSTDRYASVSI